MVLGDTLSREQLDSGTTPRIQFWNDIAAAYTEDLEEYRQIATEEPLFRGLRSFPDEIISHSSDRLHKMWKELNAAYKEICVKVTTSGNMAEFPNYVHGQPDLLYLWVRLQVHDAS